MRKYLCAIWQVDAPTRRTLQGLLCHVPPGDLCCAPFHPHITLGSYPDIEEKELVAYTRRFARPLAPFVVTFESVGLLSAGFAACFPRYDGELLRYYQDYHRQFDDLADQWTSLSGGLYRPHVSLYADEAAVPGPVLAQLQYNFRPFAGVVESLAVSWVKPQGFEIIAQFPLRGGEQQQAHGGAADGPA